MTVVDLDERRRELDARHARIQRERRQRADRVRRALRLLADPDKAHLAEWELLEVAADCPHATALVDALLLVIEDGAASLQIADRGRIHAWPTSEAA